VTVRSNGRLDFVTIQDPGGFVSACLPVPPSFNGPFDYTVFPLWSDQCTDNTPGACGGDNCTGCGIFTSVTGSQPNRIFNIEWRTALYLSGATSPTLNYEVRLYENPAENLRFDVVYGAINPANATQMFVGGVQGNSGAGFFSQDFCLPNTGTPPTNVSRTYDIPPCGATPTPTPTVTPTATPTVTPTATPRVTPTPRPRPTPHPRP